MQLKTGLFGSGKRARMADVLQGSGKLEELLVDQLTKNIEMTENAKIRAAIVELNQFHASCKADAKVGFMKLLQKLNSKTLSKLEPPWSSNTPESRMRSIIEVLFQSHFHVLAQEHKMTADIMSAFDGVFQSDPQFLGLGLLTLGCASCFS